MHKVFSRVEAASSACSGEMMLHLKKTLFLPLYSCIAFMMLVFLSACAEVPITQRKGLHLLPASELVTLSLQQYQEVIQKAKLSTNQAKVAMVKKVGERISKAAEAFLRDAGQEQLIKNYRWEFNLIEDDKVVNAWCMPGGKVAVYTGILPYTQDETGLAVVMGHEVAHEMAGHGNERMSQSLLVSLGGMALSTALSQKSSQTRQLFMTAFGAASTVGLLLPYSRLHENEADRIGLILMAKTGYDPGQAVPFWERMTKKGGSSPPEFLSTHPAPAARISYIQSCLPEALKYYQASPR